jgi:hypothetical protein
MGLPEGQTPGKFRKLRSSESMMIFVGILITLSGFVISVLSLSLNSNAARLAVVVLGLAVSLFGIIGVLNRTYLKNAIWKKG